MTSTSVREATPEDARAIAEVHVRAWRAAYQAIVPAELLDDLSVSLREDGWRSILSDPEPVAFTLLAEDPDGAVAGFCSIALPSRDEDAGERTAEIAAVYVDPSRWGSGVGRALLEQALERLRAEGWSEATLWVFRRNAQGRAFYARLGFALDGATRTHEASGATEVRMRAALAAG